MFGSGKAKNYIAKDSKGNLKEPTHYLIRVGDVVPDVVVYLRHLHHHLSWVGKGSVGS